MNNEFHLSQKKNIHEIKGPVIWLAAQVDPSSISTRLATSRLEIDAQLS
jgi:hypothetical protein